MSILSQTLHAVRKKLKKPTVVSAEFLVLSPGSLTIPAQVRIATGHSHLPNPAHVSQALESLL